MFREGEEHSQWGAIEWPYAARQVPAKLYQTWLQIDALI